MKIISKNFILFYSFFFHSFFAFSLAQLFFNQRKTTGCSSDIVFFPTNFQCFRPRKDRAAIGCTEKCQPKRVTVHSDLTSDELISYMQEMGCSKFREIPIFNEHPVVKSSYFLGSKRLLNKFLTIVRTRKICQLGVPSLLRVLIASGLVIEVALYSPFLSIPICLYNYLSIYLFIYRCFFEDFKIYSGLWPLSVPLGGVSVCTKWQVKHQRCRGTCRALGKIITFKGKTQYSMNTLYLLYIGLSIYSSISL